MSGGFPPRQQPVNDPDMPQNLAPDQRPAARTGMPDNFHDSNLTIVRPGTPRTLPHAQQQPNRLAQTSYEPQSAALNDTSERYPAHPKPYYQRAQDTGHDFDGRGNRQLIFQNANEARHWHNTNRHRTTAVAADEDPTIDYVEKNHSHIVLCMVDVVYDMSNCNDGDKMKNHFRPGHPSYISDIRVEAACHILVDYLVKSSRDGLPAGLGRFDMTASKKFQESDKKADCLTNATNMVKALRAWKSICKAIVEEDKKRWQLVSGPLSMMDTRATQLRGNQKKAQTARKNKEDSNKSEARADTTPLRPTAPATPQRQVGSSTPTAKSTPDNELSPKVRKIAPATRRQRVVRPAPTSPPGNTLSPDGRQLAPAVSQGPVGWAPPTATLAPADEMSPNLDHTAPAISLGWASLAAKSTLDDEVSINPHVLSSQLGHNLVVPHEEQTPDLPAGQAPPGPPINFGNFFATAHPAADLQIDMAHFDGDFVGDDFLGSYASDPNSQAELREKANKHFGFNGHNSAIFINLPHSPATPPPAYELQPSTFTEADIAAFADPFGFLLHAQMNPSSPLAIQAAWNQMPPSAGFSASNTGGGHTQMSPGYYNMPHYDYRTNFIYGSVPLDPPPFNASQVGGTSSMNIAQSHNAGSFNNTRDAIFSPNDIHAAHQATKTAPPPVQLPQPVIHGNYPKIGTKRTREASENFVKEKFRPSRRQKREADGNYYYDDKMSDGDSDGDSDEEQVIDGQGGSSGVDSSGVEQREGGEN